MPSNASILPIRRVLMALWMVSGFATLTLEMVWVREMSLWAGSTVTASTLIIATFFACAAAGNIFGARLLRRHPAPLRCYAMFEMLAAVSALLSLALSRSLWSHLDRLPDGWWLRAGAALLLAGPASFFSGVSFPSLAQSFVTSSGERRGTGARFYALNLFGAALGVLAGGVWLPWHLGIRNACHVAIVAQFAGGGIAWFAARNVASTRTSLPSSEANRDGRRGWTLLVVSGVLSQAALALLLLWTRQVLEGSIYAMSAVFAVFVCGLGLGALAAGWLRRRQWEVLTLIRAFSGASAAALFLLPVIGARLSFMDADPSGSIPTGLILHALSGCACVLLPVFFCVGGIFPLAWELTGVRQQGEGDTLGRALASNKLGSAAGITLGLFVLAPVASLSHATHIIGWGYAIISLTILPSNLKWTGMLVALGLWLTFSPHAPPGVAADLKLLASYSGAYGPVSVVENAQTGSRQILLNSRQRLSGTRQALDSQRHQSWVPLLLSRDARRVCTIGMAAGISADAALDFPIDRLDAIELVPDVVHAAQDHFAEWNSRLFSDPRSQVITDDGRQVLARSSESYDTIICDLLFPAEEGTGHLYSREFFQIAGSRLSDGGIFCVWLPCYQLNAACADMIAQTFLEVFPNAIMVRTSLDPVQPVVGLIGSMQRIGVSAAMLDRRLDAAHLRGRSPFLRSGAHAQMLLIGDLRVADPGFDGDGVITDDRPLFSWTGPGIVAAKEGLSGVRFLNWAGRRFPRPRFPSCELLETAPDDLLLAIRAGNHYLAAAVAATVLPSDQRPPEIRTQQTLQALERARAMSPARSLDLDDLGH